MTGEELWDFFREHLVVGQVLYISGNGGLYLFNAFLDEHRLQFTVPNNLDPGNPNLKVIPEPILVEFRDAYLDNNQLVAGEWLLENDIDWHGDCRIRVLDRLIRMPEYLINM